MSRQLELKLAEMVLGILQKGADGEFDEPAAERGTTPRHIAAAAIVEMCRQAFCGEWEGGES